MEPTQSLLAMPEFQHEVVVLKELVIQNRSGSMLADLFTEGKSLVNYPLKLVLRAPQEVKKW
jgi:hypothetical protein